MNKKTRSTKSEKWRHTCNSVEIAWTNEQKVAVTSYGRNKNHDDEIKKNQEKANNSPSYRCAAIKKSDWQNFFPRNFFQKVRIRRAVSVIFQNYT